MAIAVDLHSNFHKRVNSTKAPSTAGVTYNCVLKEGCSIIAPVIGLDLGLTANPHQYNYAKIASFGRWYYVTDWTWQDRLWWASLAVDTLASYKTDILNNTDYIVRAGTGYDGKIIDFMYPASGQMSLTKNDALPSGIWETNFNNGCYVAGVINSDTNANGAVSYYLFTPNQFVVLRNALLANSDWTSIMQTNPDLGDNLFKSLFNPFQYFVSVNWFPFMLGSGSLTLRQTTKIGWWDVNVPCYTVNGGNYIFQVFGPNNTNPSVIAYDHPQTNARGFFVNTSPFTTHRLFAPPWGEFVLDSDIIANGDWITPGGGDPTSYVPIGLEIRVDLISGIGSLRAYIQKQTEQINLLETQTTVSVPINLAQMNTNAWGQVQNIVTSGFNLGKSIVGKDAGGIISSLVTGIANGIENTVPHVQTIGNNGSITVYNVQKICLQSEYKYLVSDAITDKGRPVCKYDQLGNYSGYYVQTSGAHIDIAGYETEIEQINQALDGGVYLE